MTELRNETSAQDMEVELIKLGADIHSLSSELQQKRLKYKELERQKIELEIARFEKLGKIRKVEKKKKKESPLVEQIKKLSEEEKEALKTWLEEE